MDVLSSTIIKTRKEHKCWGCGESFPKGSHLRFQKDIDAGTIGSSYWCKVCDDVAQDHSDEFANDGVGFGDVRDYEGWQNIQDVEKRTYINDYVTKKERVNLL